MSTWESIEPELLGIKTKLDAADGEAAQDKAQLIMAGQTINSLEQQVHTLEEQVKALQEQIPKPPEPPKPVVKTLFGAGGGNTDRTKQVGVKLDRRYYGGSDVAKCVTDVQRNAVAGVQTWASFKLPQTWANMAAGKGDAWAKDLIAKLVSLDIPVWLAFHHEPEGDGVMTDWTKMQDRLSRLVPESSKVKYWLITTGWHQTKGTTAANKWPALYPKGAPIYGIAYDYPYQAYGQVYENGVKTSFNNAWTDPNFYIDAVAADAAALSAQEGRKIEAGCAEWGYGDEAYEKDKTWAEKVMKRCIEKKLLGCTYFDTKLNSSHTWWLGETSSSKRVYVEGVMKALG